jgi:nicotinamidase-related amidase
MVRPEGAYARAGVASTEVSALPGRLRPVAERMRTVGSWIVSTHFTLVPGRGGTPFIPEPVRRHRPFLGKGDFEAGRWGHELVTELMPADIFVEKITYSAFLQSRLEWVLHQAEVDTLLVGGIATHLDVAETVKDALKRDFKVLVLEDGCAAFDPDGHRKALKDLAAIAPLCSCREAITLLR